MTNREVSGGFFVQTMSAISLSIFMTYLGIFLQDLATTAIIISLIFASRNFIQIFIRVPLAEMSQIIGRKPLILFGMFMYTIAPYFLFLAEDWRLVLLATLLVAIGMSSYYPSIFAYVGDITAKSNNYGRINGVLFQGTDLGAILASFGAKYLIESYEVSLHNLFLYTFVISVFGFLLSLFILPETIGRHKKTVQGNLPQILGKSVLDSFKNLKMMSSKAALIPVFAFQLIISYSEYFFVSFSPLLFRAKGYDNADIALIVLVSTIFVLFLKPFLGSLSDRYGYWKPVSFSLLLTFSVFIMVTIATEIYFLIFLYVLFRIGAIIQYLAVNGASSNSVEPEYRGLSLGVLGFYVSFGRTSSSLILAPIWSWMESRYSGEFSLNVLFILSALLILISLGLVHLKFSSTGNQGT